LAPQRQTSRRDGAEEVGDVRESYCPECGVDQLFEQPLCIDDHGSDCPEWACVVCGFAVFTGPAPLVVELVGVARRVA
jgi:rubredoxin